MVGFGGHMVACLVGGGAGFNRGPSEGVQDPFPLVSADTFRIQCTATNQRIYEPNAGIPNGCS